MAASQCRMLELGGGASVPRALLRGDRLRAFSRNAKMSDKYGGWYVTRLKCELKNCPGLPQLGRSLSSDAPGSAVDDNSERSFYCKA